MVEVPTLSITLFLLTGLFTIMFGFFFRFGWDIAGRATSYIIGKPENKDEQSATVDGEPL